MKKSALGAAASQGTDGASLNVCATMRRLIDEMPRHPEKFSNCEPNGSGMLAYCLCLSGELAPRAGIATLPCIASQRLLPQRTAFVAGTHVGEDIANPDMASVEKRIETFANWWDDDYPSSSSSSSSALRAHSQVTVRAGCAGQGRR